MKFVNPRLQTSQKRGKRRGFHRLFRNTSPSQSLGMIGTYSPVSAVAYAFARFPIPGKNILFIVLIGTIILPQPGHADPDLCFLCQHWLDWYFLPLIVPHFFANAYNVFLLRQYFMTLPERSR